MCGGAGSFSNFGGNQLGSSQFGGSQFGGSQFGGASFGNDMFSSFNNAQSGLNALSSSGCGQSSYNFNSAPVSYQQSYQQPQQPSFGQNSLCSQLGQHSQLNVIRTLVYNLNPQNKDRIIRKRHSRPTSPHSLNFNHSHKPTSRCL